VPGDTAGSFLLVKLLDQQEAAEGDPMPPGGVLDAASTALVEAWIAAGATEECTGPIDTGSTTYHPAGFADPTVHGIEAKFQEQACTDCHGADLTGEGEAPSCDSCHTGGDAWRTSCTFCHGGDADSSGAPPEDIDDSSTDISFPAHAAHGAETIHPAWGCEQCHQTPTDIFTAGHLFTADTTAGVAELTFSAGLSTAGSFSAGTCSNLYCHGDGKTGSVGSATADGAAATCRTCHGDSSSPGSLSGDHADHREDGLSCDDCHGDAASNTTFDVPAEHVNGEINLDLPTGITMVDNHCTGSCHGEYHDNKNW
jgi:predicted CxxxxCH...CXXCH cytochrome family protein